MSDPWWLNAASAAESVLTAVGILVGGIWALYRFGLTRAKETALAIDLRASSETYGEAGLIAFFDVSITNKGAVRIKAKEAKDPAFTDESEVVKYSGDLQLRAVPTGVAVNKEIAWFASPEAKSPAAGDLEVNLLAEYYDPQKEQTDFWMEPGESYNLGVGLILAPGLYLAKVTFIGAGDGDFWRRVFLVRLPTAPIAQSGGAPTG